MGALEDGTGPGDADHSLALISVIPQVLPTEVATASFWKRCVVSDGIRPGVKVYFDRGTHESGRARGWMDCQRHGCRRCVFCDQFKSRSDFLADMYLWFYVVLDGDDDCKVSHLQVHTTEADRDDIAPRLVIADM